MKTKNIIISLISLIIFIALVYLSYLKFYQPIISPSLKNQRMIDFNQTSTGIYFKSEMHYYLASNDTTIDRLFVKDKMDITDQINKLNILPKTPIELKIISNKNGYFSLKSELNNNHTNTNIYFTDTDANKATIITDLVYPSIVSDFNVSPNSQKIVFSVLNKETNDSEINICNFDGSNLLQLTEGGISYFPVFSPDSDTIAFWRKNLGIYIINTDKTNFKKILNFEAKIDQIFVWR